MWDIHHPALTGVGFDSILQKGHSTPRYRTIHHYPSSFSLKSQRPCECINDIFHLVTPISKPQLLGHTPSLAPLSNIPPPSSTTTRPGDICAARLQMLQNLRRIVAIHIERVLIRRVAPPNLLDHVVGIRLANDGHFRGEPLLEGLCDEVAVCGEPAGHGCADVDGLGERGAGGGEDDVALVDGDVFFGVGGYADLHVLLVSFYRHCDCEGSGV
jgi:hypothetical protein